MSAPPTSEKHQKTLAGFFEKRKAQSSEDGAEMCDDDAAREEGGNQKEEQTTTTTTENNSPTQQKENIEGAAKKRKLVRKSEVLYANAKTSSSAEQTKLDNAKNLELQQQDKQPKTSEGLQHTKEKEDDEKNKRPFHHVR